MLGWRMGRRISHRDASIHPDAVTISGRWPIQARFWDEWGSSRGIRHDWPSFQSGFLWIIRSDVNGGFYLILVRCPETRRGCLVSAGLTTPIAASLYGISHSNRKSSALWGKNQFNSTFPTALACYMRDKGIPAVYLSLGEDLAVTVSEITIDELFNSEEPNERLRFDFESPFAPYQNYALDAIRGIDLVVKHEGDSTDTGWRRALEVKLTVIPDNTTCARPEADWSPELVIRPASTKYCALGIYHRNRARKDEIRDIFQQLCGNFQHWDSPHELLDKRSSLLESLSQFQSTFRGAQQPFLIQPIWKTEGKSPSLAAKAFDLFVWSDFALCRAFVEKSLETAEGVNRYMRECARLARVLYVLSTQERANLGQIYTQMVYNLQSDKAFSLPGSSTRGYLNTPRRLEPALPREVVAEIILNGGEKLLSPERRFDATIYFTTRAIFDALVPKG